MAIFVSTKRDFSILADPGGEKIVGGKLRKTPARWVNFAPNGQAEVKDEKLIGKIKHLPDYGKKFTMVSKREPKLERPKEVDVDVTELIK